MVNNVCQGARKDKEKGKTYSDLWSSTPKHRWCLFSAILSPWDVKKKVKTRSETENIISSWRVNCPLSFFLAALSSHKAKQKKVSASTNMAQFFTGGRSVFFFCWNFFTCKSGMPTSTFLFSLGAGNSNSGTGSLAARRKSLPMPGHAARVLDGWPCTCNELESAVSSFFGSSSAWSFSTIMWKKTWHRSSPASSGFWS